MEKKAKVFVIRDVKIFLNRVFMHFPIFGLLL
jgi:hypothetical protein